MVAAEILTGGGLTLVLQHRRVPRSQTVAFTAHIQVVGGASSTFGDCECTTAQTPILVGAAKRGVMVPSCRSAPSAARQFTKDGNT